MSCDVGKATEGLENELRRRWSDGKVGEWALLIIKPFRHFTYVTTHSPILPSLYLRHRSFSNTSVASPMSQHILQPLFRFSYVTGSSLTSPCEPPLHSIQVSYSKCWVNLTVHCTIISSVLILENYLTDFNAIFDNGRLVTTVKFLATKNLYVVSIAAQT